jgi:predicted metal-dependent phosphoesterase TrpH
VADDVLAFPSGPAMVIRRGMARLSGLLTDTDPTVTRTESVAAFGATTFTFAGRSPFGLDQWVYLPFEVTAGARRISVAIRHQRFTLVPGVAKNVLDLGLLDGDGQLRGWSGGARLACTVSAGDATPGYLTGPLAPGAWAVALGPVVMNPAGMAWKVRVTVETGEEARPIPVSAPPPQSIAGRGTGWYRGDMHLHTTHSDGEREPEELIEEAGACRLDFIASTEHNTISANQSWGRCVPDGMLVMPGEEVTTRHGHWLALGLPEGEWVDWRYRPDDGSFAGHAARVRAGGGLVVAAHPKVPVPGAAWEFGYEQVDAIEVWNGRWTLDDEVSLRVWNRLLCEGRRIPAVGNSDSHARAQTIGHPQTVVHADRLATVAILDGLRRGRSYVARSAAVMLALTAGAGDRLAGIGESLFLLPGEEVEVAALVRGVPWSTVRMHTANGVVARMQVRGSGTAVLVWRAAAGSARFVRVEVRRARPGRPMLALSNPIWLDSEPAPGGTGGRLASPPIGRRDPG